MLPSSHSSSSPTAPSPQTLGAAVVPESVVVPSVALASLVGVSVVGASVAGELVLVVGASVVVPLGFVTATVIEKPAVVDSSPPLHADAARPKDASARLRNGVFRDIPPDCDRPALGGKDLCRASDGAR
jgi:hypothetical protein